MCRSFLLYLCSSFLLNPSSFSYFFLLDCFYYYTTDMFLISGQYQWGELRSACNHHYQLTHNHFAVLWILSWLRFFYLVCRFLNCLFLPQIIQPQKCIIEFLQNAWGCSFNERYIRKLCGIVQVMISLKWYSIHSVSTLLMMVWDTGN